MFSENFVIYNLCFVCVFVRFGFVSSQDEVQNSPLPELSSTTETPDPASEVVCQTCNCTEPGVIDCSSREIKDFFEIQDWESLKPLAPVTVDLSQNRLTFVSRISQLPIKHLNLSHCEILTIEDGSFVYLPDLVTIDLSHNKISASAMSRRVFGGVLARGGLQPFSKARHISLAYNDIHSLPADVFAWMPGVTRLDLSGNPLAYLDQVTMAAITDLVNLRELNMEDCELESLSEGIFRRQRRLLRLDLSNNRFTTVPTALKEAVNLEYLNFGRNPIQELPSENALTWETHIDEVCRKLSSSCFALRRLASTATRSVVRSCYFATVHSVITYGLELWGCAAERNRVFSMQKRALRAICRVQDDVTCVELFRELNILPLPCELIFQLAVFTHTHLHMFHGRGVLGNAIGNLIKLQDLRLSRNSKLQVIESGALGGLPELRILHLANNPRLTTIATDFLQYSDEHAAECWPALTEFYLNNNNLSWVDSGYLHRWDQLERVDFSNNPFVCDCLNQWAVEVLTPLMMKMEDTKNDHMICLKPPELRSLSFVQLYASNKTLACPESEAADLQLPVPDMAILLGIMIGVFVTFPIVLVLVLLWRKSYFARCRYMREDDDNEETDAF